MSPCCFTYYIQVYIAVKITLSLNKSSFLVHLSTAICASHWSGPTLKADPVEMLKIVGTG